MAATVLFQRQFQGLLSGEITWFCSEKTGRLKKSASGHCNKNKELVLRIPVHLMSGVSQTIARELVTNCGSFELASDSGASFRDHQPIPFHLNIHTIFNSVL